MELATIAGLAIVLLGPHALGQPIKAAVQIAAFGHAQTVTTILLLQAIEIAELDAQTLGLVAIERARANAPIDPAIDIGLALVDRLPTLLPRGGRWSGGDGNGHDRGREAGENDCELVH